MKQLALLFLFAFVASFSVSCLAPQTQDLALFQPAQLAWPDVRSDLEAGYSDGVSEGNLTADAADAMRSESSKMEEALEAKSVDKLRLVPWTSMKPWATRGIDAKMARGEIGPTVAESFREHLRNFDNILTRLRSPTR